MMKKLFWTLLAKLGFWIPAKYCMPHELQCDWVLISFVDCKGKGVRGIPEVAEHGLSGWHFGYGTENEHYWLNNDCVVTHWRKIPTHPNQRREWRKMRLHSIKCFFHSKFACKDTRHFVYKATEETLCR